jgi:hypothetical protein
VSFASGDRDDDELGSADGQRLGLADQVVYCDARRPSCGLRAALPAWEHQRRGRAQVGGRGAAFRLAITMSGPGSGAGHR